MWVPRYPPILVDFLAEKPGLSPGLQHFRGLCVALLDSEHDVVTSSCKVAERLIDSGFDVPVCSSRDHDNRQLRQRAGGATIERPKIARMQVPHVDQVFVAPWVRLRQRCYIRAGPASLRIAAISASQRVGCRGARFAQNIADQMTFNRGMARHRVIRLMAEETHEARGPGCGRGWYVPTGRRSGGKRGIGRIGAILR